MMEYFAVKKLRKHQAEKRAQAGVQSPVLDQEDEKFLQRIVSAEGTPPPLPERPHGLGMEAGDPTGNTSQMVVHDGSGVAQETEKQDNHKDKGKGKEKDGKKSNRLSFIQRTFTKKVMSSLRPQPTQY